VISPRKIRWTNTPGKMGNDYIICKKKNEMKRPLGRPR
jgi:hypothetical protein